MNANTKFGFIPVSSSITQTPIEEMVGELIPALHSLGGEQFADDKIGESIPVYYLIVTGGTEEKVLSLNEERKKEVQNETVILLAHHGNNSLPASLEILARLQQDGSKGRIVYLDDETNKSWKDDLEKIVKHQSVFYLLKKTKIGLIGEPSDWLVASMPDPGTIKNIWGPSVIKIDLEELKEEIGAVKDEQIEEDNRYLTSRASEIKEPSKKEIKAVFKVYAALKQLVKKYEVTSVSVRCFDLVTDLKTTGCIALSKMNDEGMIAGCEGDLVSTLGMLWANYLTNQIVWMANPAQLDEPNNSIWLAHCTVPVKMVESYKLRSHFESGLGVGIEGELTKGKVTLLRLGGKNLEKIWVSNGEIIESGSSENLCRTQVKVKLHGSSKAGDLLTAPLGNHILLMRGSYAKELTEWWEMFIAKE
jgi:L-fucose isomerase-like protein